jgi:hypothetical protein
MFSRNIVCAFCFCLLAAAALFEPSPVAAQCGAAQPASLEQSYIGLYADEAHQVCHAFQPSNIPVRLTLWIWCRAEQNGIQAAEFKINYPANVETLVEHQNPEIQLSMGSLEEGVSLLFESCQTDWVWTHYQNFYLTDCMPSMIEVVGYPSTGTMDYVDCQYGPIKHFRPLNYLYLNSFCDLCIHAPFILCTSIEGPTTVHAVFYGCVNDNAAPFEDNFILYDKSNPADSIGVVQAVKQGYDEFTLTLERTMVHGTTYVLRARNLWGCNDYLRGDSEKEIFYEGPTATLLQSYTAALGDQCIELAWSLSEVDEGVSFIISRSADGGAFTELDGSGVKREGFEFTYADSGIEPEKEYTYKAEWMLAGERRFLFVSEPVATPAMRLVLHQNRPNPFNPSTVISFCLPGESDVTLDVFDISGRLVTRLMDEERQSPGAHSVDWDGRDARGKAVASGIYIYRLVAGKQSISRKMVLLK